jgi:ABC-2 type transport system permease protein
MMQKLSQFVKFDNPVLQKELKLRFRYFKSITGLIVYLTTLLIFVGGFLLVALEFNQVSQLNPSDSFALFIMLSVIQMGLVLFITPGLTAGAISTEREKQTLNMLLMTTQSSLQIVIGKLTSSIAYLGLLLIAGLPLYSIVFLFGGVSPMQLVTIFIFYFVTMVAIGSVGIFFSIVLKRTITAMITTYGTMIFLAGITAFFFGITVMITQMSMMNGGMTTVPLAYIWAAINPGALVLTILSSDLGLVLKELTGIGIPVWVTYLIFYIGLTVLMVFLSAKKLRVNMKRG